MTREEQLVRERLNLAESATTDEVLAAIAELKEDRVQLEHCEVRLADARSRAVGAAP